MANSMITPTITSHHIFINFLIDVLIHSISFLVIASVNADQNGVIIIVKTIIGSPKYLNAILYGVTSAGPNICAMIILSVENITRQEICKIKNLIPKFANGLKYLKLTDLISGFIKLYFP